MKKQVAKLGIEEIAALIWDGRGGANEEEALCRMAERMRIPIFILRHPCNEAGVNVSVSGKANSPFQFKALGLPDNSQPSKENTSGWLWKKGELVFV